MTTKSLNKNFEIRSDHYDRQRSDMHKGERTLMNRIAQMAVNIRDFVVDIYRYNNEPKPVFDNGGARVVMRSDRIDIA